MILTSLIKDYTLLHKSRSIIAISTHLQSILPLICSSRPLISHAYGEFLSYELFIFVIRLIPYISSSYSWNGDGLKIAVFNISDHCTLANAHCKRTMSINIRVKDQDNPFSPSRVGRDQHSHHLATLEYPPFFGGRCFYKRYRQRHTSQTRSSTQFDCLETR